MCAIDDNLGAKRIQVCISKKVLASWFLIYFRWLQIGSLNKFINVIHLLEKNSFSYNNIPFRDERGLSTVVEWG